MPIDNTPIVCVHKRVGKSLEIVCPYCHQCHTHGAGSQPFGTLCYGHRVEHCVDDDLRRAHLGGYILIDPRVLKVKEAEMASVFDDLDEVGKNFARVKEPEDANFFWVEFRNLARARRLELTFKQQRELFDVWLDHHRGGCDARRAALPQRVAELSAKARDLSLSLGCKYLSKRQRAKVSAQLAAVQNEITALVAPPQYNGPMATWGDAA